jgi:NADH-quinone oxidoreductase subunit I
MLCATNCPADCIHILAGESKDPNVEKFPVRFDIDTLRCVFCGYCVEACPLDAIRMDVPVVAVSGYTRDSFVYTKEFLLSHDNKDFVEGYNPPRPVAWTHGPHARP